MTQKYLLQATQRQLAARYDVSAVHPDHMLPPSGVHRPNCASSVIRFYKEKRHIDRMTWDATLALGKWNSAFGGDLNSYAARLGLEDPECRCLVPFTAFSETGRIPGTNGRLPLHWYEVSDASISSFAGIWKRAGSNAVFSILTTSANDLVGSSNPVRMPAILKIEDESCWLEGSGSDAAALIVPYPSRRMRFVTQPAEVLSKIPDLRQSQ